MKTVIDEVISAPERINEGHIAVRFGDNLINGSGNHWHVTLDGVDVTIDVDEAVAGREGWVYVPDYSLPVGRHRRRFDGVVTVRLADGYWRGGDCDCVTDDESDDDE